MAKRKYKFNKRRTAQGPIKVKQLNRRICALTVDVFTETCRRRNMTVVHGMEEALSKWCGVSVSKGKPVVEIDLEDVL